MKIYTKTGDKGKTGLFNGQRVAKDSLRVEAYGTVDELNSVLGICLSADCPEEIKFTLEIISPLLFTLGSDLATPLDPPPKFETLRVEEKNVVFLEEMIDKYTGELPKLKNFILPGGTQAAAYLHHARTVCRRAERMAVRLSAQEKINEVSLIFLNRLSDYLFVAARYANHLEGVADKIWKR